MSTSTSSSASSSASPRDPLDLALTVVKGFCMGAADIVPGVSGGTIALVFGIYDHLLDNVRRGAKALGSLVQGLTNRSAPEDGAGFVERLKGIDWLFLLPLAAGLLLAVASLSGLIEGLLHDRPEEMAGLFFGLVAGSIVVARDLLDDRSPTNTMVAVWVGLTTFLALGFQSAPAADPALWAYFGAGAIAICAMILPGISGSFILLMMGMYAAVLGSVHDRDLLNVAVFGVGAIVGLALFSTALGWVLDHHRDRLLAVLIGLMAGSFRVLWPWPYGVGIISDEPGESIEGTGLGLPGDGDPVVLPIVLAVVACFIVIMVSRLAPSEHSPPDTATDS